MSTPGFSGEAALYKTAGYYLTYVHSAVSERNVRPALPIQKGSSNVKCTNCPPDRPVACDGPDYCLCCQYGCGHYTDGKAFCPLKPDIIGGGGEFARSNLSGSLALETQ